MPQAQSLEQLCTDLFSDHQALVEQTLLTCRKDLERLIESADKAISGGGKVLFFGNGGSAADAQHLATELTVRYLVDRPAMPALALTTDTSTLTAAANDLGFDAIFSRQIEALGQPGDLAIGITTSGASSNVRQALAQARKSGLTTGVLTGEGGRLLEDAADVVVAVPSKDTPRIQEMHILMGHILCHALEANAQRRQA